MSHTFAPVAPSVLRAAQKWVARFASISGQNRKEQGGGLADYKMRRADLSQIPDPVDAKAASPNTDHP